MYPIATPQLARRSALGPVPLLGVTRGGGLVRAPGAEITTHRCRSRLETTRFIAYDGAVQLATSCGLHIRVEHASWRAAAVLEPSGCLEMRNMRVALTPPVHHPAILEYVLTGLSLLSVMPPLRSAASARRSTRRRRCRRTSHFLPLSIKLNRYYN
jgi:hypothetical protein